MAVPAIQTAPTWARSLRHAEVDEVDGLSIAPAFMPHEQSALPSPEQPISWRQEPYSDADGAQTARGWEFDGLAQSAQQSPSSYPGLVEGTVLRITFRAADTGFAVLKVRASKQQGLPAEQQLNGTQRQGSAARGGRRRQQTQPDIITVTGTFPDVSAGQLLRFEGDWVDHTTHGRQLQSMRCS